MYYIFNKSDIGYSHINNNKPCQDHSAIYKDPDRVIITCCDGHGGPLYVRSDKGSYYASRALIDTLSSLNRFNFRKSNVSKLENSIKLSILCDWNNMVEKDLSLKHLSKKEYFHLTPDDIFRLKSNPVIAYGTTLAGAAIVNNKVVVVNIGDTEAFVIRKGRLLPVFDTKDDPIANFTYSLCQEDAFNYLRVKVLDLKDVDGVLLCTDGLTGPYQTYESFEKDFVKPEIYKIAFSHNTNHLNDVIENIARKKGSGDDVTLSLVLKDSIKASHFNERTKLI